MPVIDRRSLVAGAAAATASGALASPLGSAPDLTGKAILITGTSSGFGRLGAEHYARAGAKAFATMRNPPRPEATNWPSCPATPSSTSPCSNST